MSNNLAIVLIVALGAVIVLAICYLAAQSGREINRVNKEASDHYADYIEASADRDRAYRERDDALTQLARMSAREPEPPTIVDTSLTPLFADTTAAMQLDLARVYPS